MTGRFYTERFSQIDLSDPIFDELKRDYPGSTTSTGFVDWFSKKSAANAEATVFKDQSGLGAFVYTKLEEEPLILVDRVLPSAKRMKIGTLKLAESQRGQRLGEGVLGLILWKWQLTDQSEIYITAFPKHAQLIQLLERFGFDLMGSNPDGEVVYLRSRNNIDYSTPYRSFPFINPNFAEAGLLIVNDHYHDTLFPYSELANTKQEPLQVAAANGMSKVYIGAPVNVPPYKPGEPVLIYRKYTGSGPKGYKSCVTSYAIVTNVVAAKLNGKFILTMEEVKSKVGNKSVFEGEEVEKRYHGDNNLVIVELLYYGYFGPGNNLNWVWLRDAGLWPDAYPTEVRYSRAEFLKVLEGGGISVKNTLIN